MFNPEVNTIETIVLLDELYNKLKLEPEESFRYDLYITKYDPVNLCGTVCCMAGKLPALMPNLGFKYSMDKDKKVYLDTTNEESVWRQLEKAFGITEDQSDCIFYGSDYKNAEVESVRLDMADITLEQAMERLLKVRNYIASNLGITAK